MDTELQQRLDTLVEDEVQRGWRVKSLPATVLAVLKETHELDPSILVFEHVRFRKPTPRKRRLINEAVIARYHVDLKTPHILSNEQLKKLNIERGEWSLDMEKRVVTLQDETNQRMRDLYTDGFDQREAWTNEIVTTSAVYLDAIGDKTETSEHKPLNDDEIAEARKRFDRWMLWSPDVQSIFDERYAKEQGLDKYSPDRDQQWLLDHTPSIASAEALQDLDDLKDRIRRYVELIGLRNELLDLQQRQARIFAESVEQRRETAEQLARIYYCAEAVDAAGTLVGPLCKTVDSMWDLPQEVIDWLVLESYFFYNNVPDEARDFLAQWGFIVQPENGAKEPSEGSPEVESSKSDTTPVKATESSSSVSKTATKSTTAS